MGSSAQLPEGPSPSVDSSSNPLFSPRCPDASETVRGAMGERSEIFRAPFCRGARVGAKETVLLHLPSCTNNSKKMGHPDCLRYSYPPGICRHVLLRTMITSEPQPEPLPPTAIEHLPVHGARHDPCLGMTG